MLGNVLAGMSGGRLELKVMEKYTAEVSARKIKERIERLLCQGVSPPLERKWVIEGFGGIQWNRREIDAIDFDAGFDYLSRCRAIKIVDSEKFELTDYFQTFIPEKYSTPPPLPIQVDRQIQKEAENMQRCYNWLYVFENTLRNFIRDSLSEKHDDWYEMLTNKVKENIEKNKKRWRGGVPSRNLLEFTELPALLTTIQKNWEDVFKDKFENIDQASLRESLDRIEQFRNTIAHSRMLTEQESKVFYYEIKRVLSSIKK